MDKNQAIDFIIRQYSLGIGPAEIAQQLSQQMNAPLNLVSKFVATTLDQAFPAPPASPPPAPMPDFYTSPASPDSADFIDLDAPGESYTAPDFYRSTAPEASDSGAGYGGAEYGGAEYGGDYATDDYSASYAASAAPMAQPISVYNPADLPSPQGDGSLSDSASASEADLRALENDPEVEALVLRELGRTTKPNDVVMLLCDRHGLDWKQSQRLVARIQSKNRKQLARKQNWIIFLLCGAAILGGGALVVASVVEFLRLRALYMNGSVAANAALVGSSIDYVRGILPLLLTGLGLAIGGVFGLIKAIQSQTD